MDIQGYTESQGGVLGSTAQFTYYLLDIPELLTQQENPLVIVFDILATVVIVRSPTSSSYIGKHASRRIKATLLRSAARDYEIKTSFNNINIDTEMEHAQTNLEIRDKRLYIKFTGTSYGSLFSCQANIRYAVVKQDVQNAKQIKRKTLKSVIESMVETSSAIVSHPDVANRGTAGAHPGTAITNTPAGTIAATTVQAAINELDGDITTLTAADIAYNNTAPTGDLFSDDVQNVVEELGDLINRGPQIGTITRIGSEVTEVLYGRTFGDTTVELTRDLSGNVVTVVTTYDNGINVPIVRTKTLNYDLSGNLTDWSIV